MTSRIHRAAFRSAVAAIVVLAAVVALAVARPGGNDRYRLPVDYGTTTTRTTGDPRVGP